MIKALLKCVFAICIYTTAYAQDCNFSIKGKITDFHDNTPIVYIRMEDPLTF